MMPPEPNALPAGFIESLDEKTRNIVALAVLAERQANHEKADIAEFTNLKSDLGAVKSDLADNSKAQRTYFIWIMTLMLGATGTLAALYLAAPHHPL